MKKSKVQGLTEVSWRKGMIIFYSSAFNAIPANNLLAITYHYPFSLAFLPASCCDPWLYGVLAQHSTFVKTGAIGRRYLV